jgi:hypothetical protein
MSFYFRFWRSSSRSFSSLSTRCAKSAAKRVPSQTNSTSRSKVGIPDEETLKFAGRRPRGLGLLERKVAQQGSVVLFEAPPQRGYIIGAYSIAAFAFTYAVYNSHVIFRDPKTQQPKWVQIFWGGMCVLMSMAGTVFISKTSRLVKAVTAVHLNGATYLRFSVRRMLPFRKPIQFDVLPRQIVFSRKLIVDPNRVTAEGGVKAREHISQVSFFKAPLKRLNYAFFRMFLVVRQLFTGEDFILLEVQGKKGAFRMDSNGFVSDDLLFLGNPVSVKYS